MSTLPRNHLGSDQLYPDEYGYPNNGGGGYFNPLEAMTSSPLRSRYVLYEIFAARNNSFMPYTVFSYYMLIYIFLVEKSLA